MKNDLLQFPSKVSCLLLAMLMVACNPANKIPQPIPPHDIIGDDDQMNTTITQQERGRSLSRQTDGSIHITEGDSIINRQTDNTGVSPDALEQRAHPIQTDTNTTPNESPNLIIENTSTPTPPVSPEFSPSEESANPTPEPASPPPKPVAPKKSSWRDLLSIWSFGPHR